MMMFASIVHCHSYKKMSSSVHCYCHDPHSLSSLAWPARWWWWCRYHDLCSRCSVAAAVAAPWEECPFSFPRGKSRLEAVAVGCSENDPAHDNDDRDRENVLPAPARARVGVAVAVAVGVGRSGGGAAKNPRAPFLPSPLLLFADNNNSNNNNNGRFLPCGGGLVGLDVVRCVVAVLAAKATKTLLMMLVLLMLLLLLLYLERECTTKAIVLLPDTIHDYFFHDNPPLFTLFARGDRWGSISSYNVFVCVCVSFCVCICIYFLRSFLHIYKRCITRSYYYYFSRGSQTGKSFILTDFKKCNTSFFTSPRTAPFLKKRRNFLLCY